MATKTKTKIFKRDKHDVLMAMTTQWIIMQQQQLINKLYITTIYMTAL